jgi:hypothetical protein
MQGIKVLFVYSFLSTNLLPVRFQELINGEYEYDSSDDWGSTHLWNVRVLQQDYTTQCPSSHLQE